MDAGVAQLGLVEDGKIDLAEAALRCAAADRPAADAGAVRAWLTGLAARLVAEGAGLSNARARARLLAEMLGGREGLHGDSEDYDNPDNADLIALHRRRRGLPVILSIVYVALARRVGWNAHALNVPGHVLVRVDGEGEPVIVDPFDGGRPVGRAGMAAIVARTLGAHTAVEREHLEALNNRQVLIRLLTNQATRARRAGDVARALVLHDRMTAIAPRFAGLWWERARLEQLAGDNAAARRSLAAMLEVTRDKAARTRIRAALEALARSHG